MKEKEQIFIIVLVLLIIIVVIGDLFLVFNKKNNYSIPSKEIEHASYNCQMNGKALTPYEDVKVYMYDIEGNISLKYSKKQDSYIVTGKEDYKFVDPANYLCNVEKMKLFKNHEYKRDDENATIKLDYEEFVEYDEIFKYMEQLKETGYACSEIS